MTNLEMKLIRTMNEVIKERENERCERMKRLERPEETEIIKPKIEPDLNIVSNDYDYTFATNVLCARLQVLVGELHGYIRKKTDVTEEEWNKITGDLVEAYNYAAKNLSYKVDYRTLP